MNNKQKREFKEELTRVAKQLQEPWLKKLEDMKKNKVCFEKPLSS
jgi:hypothetical protein